MLIFLLLLGALAKLQKFDFNLSLVKASPDGFERAVIGINGEWPLPIIRVKKGDEVSIRVTNLMPRNSLLHFHGLFMNGTNSMDGPEFVTQCPIPPGHEFTYNFKVEQAGTYWYHSHLGSQYSDGLRNMFIVEDEKYPFEFDHEVPLTISDWYHSESLDIMQLFMSRYNPTGAEPIPQNALFNDTKNATFPVATEKTYFLRIVNMGMFVSQYLYIEDHTLTIVEVDGVYVQPVEVDSLYIGVAQRYGVLLKTKKTPHLDVFRFVNVLDEPMLDELPADLQIISTNYLRYGAGEAPLPIPNGKGRFDELVAQLHPYDDFKLVPLEPEDLLEPDLLITLNFTMEHLGDGVTYAMFNGVTYTPPKVPTLYSVLSAGDLAANPIIYGSNTNTHVLQHNEVVEIVLNNMDAGLHPFHLHGHTFQVVARSEGTDDDDNPQIYDPKGQNFPQNPLVRDTVMVNANGYVVLRFRANNPGVWFFHCHVDWHLEQGLAIVFVEAPELLQQQTVPAGHFAACKQLSIPTRGNAAGSEEWLNLEGENVQVAPLPPGFTRKGYVAIVACAAAALYGIYTIYIYGMEDVTTTNAGHVVAQIKQMLGEE